MSTPDKTVCRCAPARRSASVERAIADALAEEMRRDPRVVVFGEGVAAQRPDLLAEFGPTRVRNTPLAEAVIAGAATGAAAMGLRPVIDLLYAPLLMLAMDAIVNSAGKLHFLSAGQFSIPLVVLAQTGSGCAIGGRHNHNLEAMFAHAPGLKVVMPSAPADFKGLLKAAIRDDNPVLFFIDMGLSEGADGWPAGDAALLPLGRAAVLRRGSDLTLVAHAKTVGRCLQAAERLAAHGVSAEVIDLRTLKPLDEAALLGSVRKTGRLLIVHEAARCCGIGAEIAAIAGELAFDALRAPLVRLTGPDAPAAASAALERAAVPDVDAIVDAALRQFGDAPRHGFSGPAPSAASAS
ncbi:alpha-ketoacid dehydrogenase subunit beta [Piscinibacter sakaiensis]|uniref:alpha-ketoacid dehydrogenase subunit beta n=1 Tax=Piscinibacter sakaiensis TaxID=1547922 RepID=UPI003AB0E1DD